MGSTGRGSTDLNSDTRGGTEAGAPVPQLLPPALLPLPLWSVSAATVGALSVAVATGFLWFAAPATSTVHKIPVTADDLGEGMVLPIDASDRAAVAAAASALRLPDAQRQTIEREVLERRRRLAWIVLTDSMDPDGDTVAVEASGLVQHVVLNKAWIPVAVPIDPAGPIGITAVRDGGGGGVTVALGTRGGPVAMRIMLPGERIEVMP